MSGGLDCQADWVEDTNTTAAAQNNSQWIRYGLDLVAGEIGYDHQINGTNRYKVLDCDGLFNLVDPVTQGQGNHAYWFNTGDCLGAGAVAVEVPYDNVTALHSEPHPWDEAPDLSDGNLGIDDYTTVPLMRDDDTDPPVSGVCYEVEAASLDAFQNAGDVPYSGFAYGVLVNHQEEYVFQIQSSAYVGGVKIPDSGENIDMPNTWEEVRCADANGNPDTTCRWDEIAVQARAFFPGTIPVGWYGSEVHETHEA